GVTGDVLPHFDDAELAEEPFDPLAVVGQGKDHDLEPRHAADEALRIARQLALRRGYAAQGVDQDVGVEDGFSHERSALVPPAGEPAPGSPSCWSDRSGNSRLTSSKSASHERVAEARSRRCQSTGSPRSARSFQIPKYRSIPS